MIIKCPECKGKVSNTATICPHCGFNVKDYIDSAPITTSTKTTQKEDAKIPLKKHIKYILSFRWMDKLHDKLSSIPIIGGLLALLFVITTVMLICGVIVLVIASVIFSIYGLNPALALVIIIIGANVIAWFSSYKWGRHKFYFWLCLIVSILFLFIFGFAF